MNLVVYTDGASRGNPGPASYGFTIADEKGRLLIEAGEYIGTATNNVAEYKGVMEAFKKIIEKFSQDLDKVDVYADSKLVAEQLSGRYKIKSPHLKLMIDEIKELESRLGVVIYHHVPRAKNTEADKLANKALDAR